MNLNISRASQDGFAPYEITLYEGWEPAKTKVAFPAYYKTISSDHHDSVFTIQVHKMKQVTGKEDTSLVDYSKGYTDWLKKRFKAKIIAAGNYKIDDIPAKQIVYVFSGVKKSNKRVIIKKCHDIIFKIEGYAYCFQLASYGNDYAIADKEFEAMVQSFHFKE